jgi:putative CocE/NonD family hydrolase
MEPGKVYKVALQPMTTSNWFEPGHRIRIEVSSSNFPRFDRNMNTTAPNAEQAKPAKARQTVFHEKGYPSAIILPVVGRSRMMSVSRR